MDSEASLGSVPECGEKARAWDGGAICSETRKTRATITSIYNTSRTCVGYVFVDSNSVGLDCSIKEEKPKSMLYIVRNGRCLRFVHLFFLGIDGQQLDCLVWPNSCKREKLREEDKILKGRNKRDHFAGPM
jgi:hypothetical protein